MRKLVAVMVSSLAFAGMSVGTGIASEDDNRGDREYRHDERHESKIYGSIEKLPKDFIGIWVISGQEVLVTKATYIKEEYGKTAVGAYVEVEGGYTGKSFTARKIEVKGKHR